MADQEFEAARAELAAALDVRVRPIDENAGEARRLGGVLVGAAKPAAGEKSIGDQIFDYKPAGEGGHPFRTYVLDRNTDIVSISARTDRTEQAVKTLGERLDQILAILQVKQ